MNEDDVSWLCIETLWWDATCSSHSRWRSFRLESTEPWPSKLDINMVGHIIHLHTLSACQPSISSQMPHPVWWQGPGFGRWPSSIFWGVASGNETWRADACCKISHVLWWSSQCFLFFSREVCHSNLHKACVTSHHNFPIQTSMFPGFPHGACWDPEGSPIPAVVKPLTPRWHPGNQAVPRPWQAGSLLVQGWWSQSQSYYPCWFKTPKQGRILSCGIKSYKHV